jgi:hypothetical protein
MTHSKVASDDGSLDIAARGKPSLVFATSIFRASLQRHQVLADLRKNIHDVKALEGDGAVKITLPDGTIHRDENALI